MVVQIQMETVFPTLMIPGPLLMVQMHVFRVLEDTDGDGMPDTVTGESTLTEDTDDDNDGFTDLQEEAAGTDPLDPASVMILIQMNCVLVFTMQTTMVLMTMMTNSHRKRRNGSMMTLMARAIIVALPKSVKVCTE